MLRSSQFRFAVFLRQRGETLSAETCNTNVLPKLTVSDSTWARLAYLNKRDQTPNRWLRLQIVPGGCRGFTYKFVLQNPDTMNLTTKTTTNSPPPLDNKKDAGCTSSGSDADVETPEMKSIREGEGKGTDKKEEQQQQQLSSKAQQALKKAQELAAKFEKEDKESSDSAAAAPAENETYEDDIEFINDSCVPLQDPNAPPVENAKPTTEKFVVDEVSLNKLRGAKIDFVSGLRGMAFFVDGNENVDKSCACKLSFSMKGEE